MQSQEKRFPADYENYAEVYFVQSSVTSGSPSSPETYVAAETMDRLSSPRSFRIYTQRECTLLVNREMMSFVVACAGSLRAARAPHRKNFAGRWLYRSVTPYPPAARDR